MTSVVINVNLTALALNVPELRDYFVRRGYIHGFISFLRVVSDV